MRPTRKRKPQFAHLGVTALGLLAGVLSLAYAPSAWLALAPFVLAIWISPSPRIAAGLVTLILLGAGALAILGHLPYGIENVFAIGTGMALTWMSSLFLGHKNQHPTLTFGGLRRLIQASPVGMLLINDDHQVILDNKVARQLLGMEGNTYGTPLGTVARNDQLMQFVNGEEDSSRFDDKPLTLINDLSEQRTQVTISGRRFNQNGRSYVLLCLQDCSAQLEAQRQSRARMQDMHAALSAVDDLVLTLNERGEATWFNAAARRILPVPKGKSEPLALPKLVDASTDLGAAFRHARTHAAGTEDLSLSSRSRGKQALRARIQQLPRKNGFTLVAADVTRENALQEALARREALHKTLMQNSPNSLLIMERRNGRILEANHSSLHLLGYTAREMVGRNLFDSGLFALEVEAANLAEQIRSGIESLEGEITLRNRAGDKLRTEFTLRSGTSNGQSVCFLYWRDITRKHLAEAALRESQEKFSRVFTESPDGIAILDFASMSIVDVNIQFASSTGQRPEDIINEPISRFLADASLLQEAGTQAIEQSHVSNLEVELIDTEGKRVPSLVSVSSVDLNGKPCLLCIAKDIRQQRETENKLRRSEQRFRSTFENAPLGMLLADTSGRIFQANRFAADLLAYEGDSLTGLHLSRLVPANGRVRLLEVLEQLIAGEVADSHSERRLVSQHGLEIWVNLHVVLQRSEEGNPLYFIIQMADITEMKRSQERMERLAFYDTLTDLANRRLFNDRLQQAITRTQRNRKSAALMYLDLDQFKRVNDTLGHDAGDALLKHVSLRLQKCVRKEDTVARPGGDEFTIILYDISAINDASRVAEKILDELRKPISIAGQQLVVTTSIGITLLPQDSNDAQTLMRNADMAMYKAKERGRNNYQFFSEDMNQTAINRLRIETELRDALKRDQFELYYQPKIRLADQKLTGVECLIRWNHPKRGILGPHEFIAIAEESGFIVDIGTWVIEQSCIAGRQLRQESGQDFQVALNISPRQFRDPNLITTIRRCLRETELPPEALEIEITETMLMQDVEAASQTVQRLHDLGADLAIDDFGTGYSSLNYLKKFPINTVKVDRSFVIDIPESEDDMAITSAVIAMAHQLKMEVVAEGVETPEQLNFLRRHNCEYAQGYLFGRPMPLKDLRELITVGRLRMAQGQ